MSERRHIVLVSGGKDSTALALHLRDQRSPKAVATADLGEAEVDQILDHRGSAKHRATLEFRVLWRDGEETWEAWEQVKKLAEIDHYIRAHPEAKLKSLLQK